MRFSRQAGSQVRAFYLAFYLMESENENAIAGLKLSHFKILIVQYEP